jgi:hypothetical protein
MNQNDRTHAINSIVAILRDGLRFSAETFEDRDEARHIVQEAWDTWAKETQRPSGGSIRCTTVNTERGATTMITHTEITRDSDWDTGAEVEGLIYIRAICEITITPEGYNHGILQTLSSPGLYGIDDNSSKEYLDGVWQEERQTLIDMLQEIGAKPERR